MLRFSGNAFEASEVLQTKYSKFIATSSISPFMSIEYEGEWDAAFFSLDDPVIQIRNFILSKTVEADTYHVKCNACRFIVQDKFSRIYMPKHYLHNLQEHTYNQVNEGIYQLARFRALFTDMLVIHAAAVVYHNEVLLFSGVSGAGKSTQAGLWKENADAWVLNYDKPVLKFCGELVLASGSPWGGKEDLAIDEVRPVKALFFVHQAKENRVVRLSAAQAYARVQLNYFVYPLTEDIEKRYNDAVIWLIKKIPVYDLYCTDTVDAVEVVRQALYPEEE